ncbi:hypothetical protein [Ochrobactrum quorumnocens]
MHNLDNSKGFNLPTAYKSSSGQITQMVVIATLFSCIGIAGVLAAQMWWG